MMKITETFTYMRPEDRPQDPVCDGSGLRIMGAMEHGGDVPDAMPMVLRIEDTDGNWCHYVPMEKYGRVVQDFVSHAQTKEN